MPGFRVGLAALLTFGLACAEPPTVFSIELAIGYDDAVSWNILGLSLAGEEAVCNASGGLEVARTDENTVVDLRDVVPDDLPVDVNVLAGNYVFFAEGYDVDVEKTAQGCGSIQIEAGQTRALQIDILPYTDEAVCGDGTRAAFEQCDPEPHCDEDCNTIELQANTNTALAQTEPSIGVGDPFVVAFASSSTIRYRAFRSDGRPREGTWGNDRPVDGAEAESYEMSAVGVGGVRHVVAFTEIVNLGGGDIQRDVRFTANDFSEERDTLVGEGGQLANDAELDDVDQEAPAVAVQNNGSFAVAWIEGAGVVRARGFGTGAAPVGGSVQISDGGGAIHVALAALANGNYVAVWERGGARFRIFGEDASPVGEEVSAGAVGIEVSVGTTFDGTGFALTWIDAGGAVQFRAYDQGGNPLGDASIVSDGGTNATPAVAGATRYYVVWQSDRDIWGRYVEPAGDLAVGPMSFDEKRGPSSAAFRVSLLNDGTQSDPVIAMSADFAFVAWQDGGREGRDDPDGGIRYRFLTEPAE